MAESAAAAARPLPRLSVIVSTYNSPVWLEKVLWGFQVQTLPGFEIVVADDGSTRETAELLRRYADSGRFSVRHVWHEDRGFRKCAILNKAIEAAVGDYLIFTDGDCIPHPEFVATHARLAEPGCFLTGSCCRMSRTASESITRANIESGRLFRPGWLLRRGHLFTPLGRRAVLRALGMNRLLDRRTTPENLNFHGNNASCWRTDALAVNGFDTRLGYGGEDREFGYRLGHSGVSRKIIRYSALTVHLFHERGYKSDAVREANLALIAGSVAERRVQTPFGLAEGAAEAPPG